jgi:hypothetical protein
MSEWNLSVRLTGQGSDLATTLRDSAKEARTLTRRLDEARRAIQRLRTEAANGITVRLDVDGDHLRSDVEAALTSAGAGQGLSVRLGIDSAGLRDDVQTALTSAGTGQGIRVPLNIDADHLRDEVNTALTSAGAGQGLGVSLHLTNTMQLRRDVTDAVRWAAWGHRIEIPLVLGNRMGLRHDVTDAVRWASMNQTITVRVRADTSDLGDLTQILNRPGGGGGGGGMGGALQGLLMLAPAAIPLLAGLGANLAPLAGQFAAGGTAAAAFGIALAGQIGPLGEVVDAEKKYQDAIVEHGRTSKEAMEAQYAYQQQLAKLPPETQKTSIALSTLKEDFSGWSDDMSRFTMEPVTKSLAVLDELIPRLTPHVKTASTQLDRLVTVAGGAVETPGFDAMADRFADFTDRQLDEMTDKVMHFMRMLSEGKATDGPISEFMQYARENGPAAREAIRAISDAVVTLMRGASEAGPSMLTLVTAVARLVAALPPELVGIIIQVATALKILQLSGAGMAALAGGLARVRTQITGLATASAAAGGGLAGLRAAFATLGTAGKASIVVAGIAAAVIAVKSLADMGREAPPNVDKLTTSLGNLGRTGKVSGEAARAFGKDLGGLHDKVKALTDPSNADKIQQGLVKTLSLGNWDSTPVKEAKANFDAIDKSLANLVQGGKADIAAAALKRMEAAYVKSGGSASDFRKKLDDYKSALADQKFEQELAAQSMGLFGKAAQETQGKLDAQKKSADGLRQSIQALNDVNRAAGSAMSAFEQSLDDATEAVKGHENSLKVRNGELDLGSQKARDAEKVLSELAANTDAAATSAREQGKSWEYVSGIYSKGRKSFVEAADSMGLTREQAEALADTYLSIPDSKTTKVEMRTEDAIAGLDSVIAAIQKTPNAKSVTVKALTADAVTLLESLGFKVTRLPNGQFKVTAETGDAKARLAEVKRTRDGLKNKSIKIDAATMGAIKDLENLKSAVRSSKGKTITMRVPTAEGRHQLELLGFKIKSTKGKRVTVSVPTGTPRSQVAAIQGAIAALRGKTVTITTKHVDVFEVRGTAKSAAAGLRAQARNLKKADGGLVDYYANGGIQRGGVRRFADGAENHVAEIAPAGSWRMWAEPETGGEAYIPLAPTKRLRSRAIAEETIRRLGGDPQTIAWNANGSVTDWRYDPQTGSLYSASDAGQAGHKTKKVRVKGKNGKYTTKEVEYFSLDAVEGKLMKSARAARAWNKDLSTVADRVGADVAQALAGMGEDGVALTRKMAHGSKRYIELMAKQLRDLGKTAKASLTDYTRQMEKASSSNSKFQADLAKLAGMGYGDLASQLAAQGDQAAIDIASSAVKDRGKAKKANDAAKRANNALTSEQVAEMVQIIAAVTSSKVGIHAVAEKTGIGEDEIVTVATKAKGQISSALGGRAAQFLSDLARAQKGLSYANGGIRAGLYSTGAGLVRFAEPETGGEAYIPLGANKRASATGVLTDVAHRFGLGLTDANAGGRVVIIREQGPLVGQQTWNVSSGGNAVDTARRIDADNSYQLRRLARGGVGAR